VTGTVEQLFELEETSFEKGCVITVRVLGKRALAPQRMHWMSAFLQTCMQPLNPMLHWPRPWIEAVNLCTRLSSRRSLGSPWLARHPTTTSTVMGANHFKWSVLVANSPSPMCASSLIPPLVLSLVTSTLYLWGSWIQSLSVLGGSVFWWELLVPVLLNAWENQPGFSFQNYFRFIFINQGILFSLNFDQAHSQIRRFS